MTGRSATALAILLVGTVFVSAQGPQSGPAVPPEGSGGLRQLIPGHYVWSSNSPKRAPYNSGFIVTGEGVVVLDALESEATGRAQREAIASVIKQPVRALVSSAHHENYSKGNIAYQDVLKIGHENYRSDLLALMERGKTPADEQRARLPTQTFRDRLTLYLGGKGQREGLVRRMYRELSAQARAPR